jgi:hypothetical protein
VRVRLTSIKTGRSGSKTSDERDLDVPSLRIGRGTENDLCLNDLSLSLNHLRLEMRGRDLFVVRTGAGEVLVNGRAAEEEEIGTGDEIRIGRFELRVVEPPTGADVSLELEERKRLGEARSELDARTRIGVERGFFTRRKLVWTLCLAAAGLGYAVSRDWARYEKAWNSGPISVKHAFIANDCKRCHETAFEPVPNTTCLTCHAAVGHHTPEIIRPARLSEARCASCHVEHNGLRGLAALGSGLCSECHADLAGLVPDTEVDDASDFHSRHPQFRLRLASGTPNGARRPEYREWRRDLRESPGVRFNHLHHVGTSVPHPDGESAHVDCGRCHALDAGGMYMRAVSFEENCQSCHSLDFDDAFGDLQAPHGDPVEMRRWLRGLYADRLLQAQLPELPRSRRPSIFVRPGQQLTQREREIVYRWVEEQMVQADQHLMGTDGECARCHEPSVSPAKDGGRGLQPVSIPTVWMPKSGFRHETHSPFACRDCHPAAAVYDPDPEAATPRPAWSFPESRPYALFTPSEIAAKGLSASTSAQDVLVPGIDTCRECHGGATARPPLVASECVLCHPFHRSESGPMGTPIRETTAERLE